MSPATWAPNRKPVCIICWSLGRNTEATVFVDPGWYCTGCAAQPMRERAYRQGLYQGLSLALAIVVAAVVVGVLTAYSVGVWAW